MKKQKNNNINGFIRNLRTILNNQEYKNTIHWDDEVYLKYYREIRLKFIILSHLLLKYYHYIINVQLIEVFKDRWFIMGIIFNYI